jgi:hypothetical protein
MGKKLAYEFCKEEALKYKTRGEFGKKSKNVYESARKNKWLDDICKHMFPVGNKFYRVIYAYEFIELNCVYIGLTYSIIKRDSHHRQNGTVFNFINKHSVQLPQPKLLTDYLIVENAIKEEKKWIEIYKNRGFIVLNKISGGGIGGGDKTPKLSINEYKKIAKTVRTIKEFKQSYIGHYRNILKLGIKEKVFNKNFYKNYIECGNCKPIVQLKLDGEFIKSFKSAYFAKNEYGYKSYTNITACCRGRAKSAYGYIWKYKKDYEKI